MLLDQIIPTYDFNEVHTIAVLAQPEFVFCAIKEVTPAEIPLFPALFALRALPSMLTGKGKLLFTGDQPLLEQALQGGFVLLAEEAERELVLGIVGQFWKLQGSSPPRISSSGDFRAFDQPGYAKAAMNFLLNVDVSSGITKVYTETRIQATDPLARRRFAAYWRLIHLGSALIRRTWLGAIKRRVEQKT